MNKLISIPEALNLITDGMTVVTEGFIGAAHPEAITAAIEQRYLETGSPKKLTLVYAAGQGDGVNRGCNHFAQEGLVRKVIGGHWNLVPKLGKLANENKFEAYCLPQGVICHLLRDISARKPGTITTVGLGTFVDPRMGGGKINSACTEDIVELIYLDGQEYLRYLPFSVDCALIRGTNADTRGNVSLTKEISPLAAASLARAAKACGGKVIVQVENIVEYGSIDPRLVTVPGIYVDAVVVAPPSHHMQTFEEQYNPAYCGDIRAWVDAMVPMPLNERKVVCRRAVMELTPQSVVNLGIGMPEGVARVANEEGIADGIILTVESGGIGGLPASGLSFGATLNPEAIVDQASQFDFYMGGGIDLACLGLAQADKSGSVNVSKFGGRVAGCGGFIEITQNAKKVLFCGTFTSGGLKISLDNGKLHVLQEGNKRKFVNAVEQCTFSGPAAAKRGSEVLYITERAVFKLESQGLVLTEIAPGADIKKDVLSQMDFLPLISDTLKLMDSRLFLDEEMGLSKEFI